MKKYFVEFETDQQGGVRYQKETNDVQQTITETLRILGAKWRVSGTGTIEKGA
jgi:hypothetical protein